MALRPARRPRGRRSRPREHTALVSALVGRHDAQSRRTARKIAQLHQGTVPLEAVTRLAGTLVAQLGAALEAIPARYVARRPEIVAPDAVTGLLREEFGRIVGELAAGLGLAAAEADGFPVNGNTRPAAEGPPPVRRSPTLAAARAQGATLQAYWIDMQERIVPYHGPSPAPTRAVCVSTNGPTTPA